jgi:uncharacterized membrane protein YcaP (DUF421 family)
MKKEEIHLIDWPRILFGEVPPTFYLEILIRAAFVYLLLVASMRMMGLRMSLKLSRNEMAAMISLAAAIGIPILDASRGLLPAVVIAAVVVFTQRLVSYWAASNEQFEGISQDIFAPLVENSVMQLDIMRDSRITRELLFAQLRSSGVTHLGYVKRLYIEANGAFTLVKNTEPQPGLSVLPDWDDDFKAEQQLAEDKQVCNHCGNPKPTDISGDDSCANCGYQDWVPALA